MDNDFDKAKKSLFGYYLQFFFQGFHIFVNTAALLRLA